MVEFRKDLEDLCERHIFQWSTFYRDCRDLYFDRFLRVMKRPWLDDPVEAFAEPLADHTHSVFSRGYNYVRKDYNHKDAVTKSLNGLSQFLALPLGYYSAQASNVNDYRSTIALRLLFSASLTSILDGYYRVQFGEEKGSSLLAKIQRQWVHYTEFLTPKHAEHVITCLESGPLTNGLKLSALPLLEILQSFFHHEDDDYWPIPVLGQYSWPERRLDISIHPPRNAVSQRLIEIRAFLEEGYVNIGSLEHALDRQIELVVAPLRPDMWRLVNNHERLKTIVVSVNQPRADTDEAVRESQESTAKQAFDVLDDALYALRSRLKAKSPITYNCARRFPLYYPSSGSPFHVNRTSVRDLLRTFERRNGVRPWCCIRRSGKTTACFDLETTTGDSVIVGQTCGAPPTENADLFYSRVRDVVESGLMVSNTFIRDTIKECAPFDIEGRRIVFILDEYETFFGFLQNAVKINVGVLYSVVQPILNQLTAFSKENLLVLIGQHPDAYFILMDHNQIAPCVTQDPFPLFEHISGTATGEFSKLVKKILSGRIECTAGFLDALHGETAGNPFLTANLLIEFVDWLIEERRAQSDLRVLDSDFKKFARKKLVANQVLLSREYEFFRQAESSALSEQGFRDNPWLFEVYWILREFSGGKRVTFRISRTHFQEVAKRIPVPKGGCLSDSSVLLRTASQANFLSYDNRSVNVRIRTLGRIAAAVRPALA